MIIKNLEIINFRGIKNLHFDFNKKINVFSGRNGIGKTSVIDAIMWMLTDETLVYEKQNADNRNTNNLKEVVNVILELANENENYVLERKYYDSYKTDMNGDLIFAKTVNEFKINGAKYGAKEYIDFIKYNVLKLDRSVVLPKEYNIVRSVVDYNYFGKIDYKIARSFLESILELESDEDILKDEKFASVKRELQSQRYDVTKTVSKLKSDFENCKNTIANQEFALKQLEEKYDEEKSNLLEQCREERDLVFSSNPSENTVILGLNRLLQEVEENIKGEEKNKTEAIFESQQKITSLVNIGTKTNTLLQEKNNNVEKLENDVEKIKVQIEALKGAITEQQKRSLPKNECPNCGFQLNVEETKEFEKSKEMQIAKTEEVVNSLVEQINEKMELKKNLVEEIEELNKKQKEYGESFYKEKERLEELQKQEETEFLKTLKERKEELEKQRKEELEKLTSERNQKLADLNAKIESCILQKDIKEKIELAKETIKKNKIIANHIENNIDLAKDFKKTKIEKIKEKVNKVFPELDIEILEENQNTGAIKEVCYLKLQGTEYKGINDGHRKMIGITFIENIKKKLNLENLPIIFDKMADVDKEMLYKINNITNSQIFTTKVGEEEKITLC